MSGFVGQMQRPEITSTYKLGIVGASLVMISVPIMYGLTVLLLAIGMLFYVTAGLVLLSAGFVGLVIYVVGVVAGSMLLLFMIKPLFHRQSESDGLRTITPEYEPLLFDFVQRICDQVKAPYPVQIDVDCSVNAAAALVSVFNGKLRLIIGLPLVAGFSLQQFAGVLAHEFGHFTQGAGMRLTNLINRTDSWLARVVFERDSWDEWLVNASHGIDIRIGWVFYIARAVVWVTRKIMWCILFGSRIVVGYMMREMEFDADRCETRLAGSHTFETTCRQLALLTFAHRDALGDLSFHFREGRLADDFPRLIIANLADIPPKIRRKMLDAVDQSTTGIMDSHPCDRDRISSSRRENAPGVFRSDLPATVLFRDFKEAAKAVTWDFYRDLFDGAVPHEKLRSVDEIIARNAALKAAQDAGRRFLAGTIDWIRPVRLPAYEIESPHDAVALKLQVTAARDYLLANVLPYRALQKRLDEADERATYAAQAIALYGCGIVPNLEVNPPFRTRQAAVAERDELIHRLGQMHTQAEPFEIAAGRRMFADLSLLCDPRIAARIPNAAALRSEAEKILPVLSILARYLARLVQMRNQYAMLAGIFDHLDDAPKSQHLFQELMRMTAEMRRSLLEIRDPLEMIEYPFDHAEGFVTAANYVLKQVPSSDEVGSVYECSASFMQDLMRLYYRCTGRLCEIAESVEGSLGLPPVEFPKSADELD